MVKNHRNDDFLPLYTANAAQRAGDPVDCAEINKRIRNLERASVASNFAESTAYQMAGGASFGEAIANTGADFLVDTATDYGVSKLNRLQDCFCFVEGTPVLTALGLVAIETISAGDIVIATDIETGETAEKEVVEVYVNESSELVHLTINGEEITTTPAHPFYVPQKGWTSAIDLRAGDMLVLVNGEYVTVEAVQHEILESPVTVYNFQVEDFHTYYVGEQSVLVHNQNNKNGCGIDSDDGTDAVYIPTDVDGNPIPLNKQRINGQDIPLPDPVAEGRPHTVLGGKTSSETGEIYRQSATFYGGSWPTANGYEVPISEVHWTDHGRADVHSNPHQHVFIYDFENKYWYRSDPKGF